MNVKLIALGPFIEDPHFWEGFDVERGAADWIERADLVVLPAFIEHKPTRLLMAVAAGIPVVATPACGVSHVTGVNTVRAGESDELRQTIQKFLPSLSI